MLIFIFSSLCLSPFLRYVRAQSASQLHYNYSEVYNFQYLKQNVSSRRTRRERWIQRDKREKIRRERDSRRGREMAQIATENYDGKERIGKRKLNNVW